MNETKIVVNNMDRTFTESATTVIGTGLNLNSASTTDVSLAEIAMRQVNAFFAEIGINEEEFLQEFEENRGASFERFYGSMDTSGS